MLDLAIDFFSNTGFALADYRNLIMLAVGCACVFLGAIKRYEPLLLIPIGLGIIIGNIPFPKEFGIGIYEDNSVLHYLYFGVTSGIYPSLIFLGLGAMTDFSSMLSQPKLMLLGAAAQVGVFVTLLAALGFGFSPQEATAIGIIGGADGPISIFLAAKLAPHLIGPIAIAGYAFVALIPVMQTLIMKLLTTRRERCIKMPDPREISKKERMIFPIIGLMSCCFLVPAAIPLLGPFFFGNFLKECEQAERLAQSARTVIMGAAIIFLGLAVGAGTRGDVFLTSKTIGIFLLGAMAFSAATVAGILFAKIMNLFMKGKINPLLGAAGVPAIPGSARAVNLVGLQENPDNPLIEQAMACGTAGLIGSAITAGVLWSFMLGG